MVICAGGYKKVNGKCVKIPAGITVDGKRWINGIWMKPPTKAKVVSSSKVNIGVRPATRWDEAGKGYYMRDGIKIFTGEIDKTSTQPRARDRVRIKESPEVVKIMAVEHDARFDWKDLDAERKQSKQSSRRIPIQSTKQRTTTGIPDLFQKSSSDRFAISGHSRDKWFGIGNKEGIKERGTKDLTEFLSCVRTEFPSLTLVAGDATGVDRTGAEIFENLGGNVIKVPHDTFRWPTDTRARDNPNRIKWELPYNDPLGRNSAMLKGGYETTDSEITKAGFFGERVKGEKVKGRKAAKWGTSPSAGFLAYFMSTEMEKRFGKLAYGTRDTKMHANKLNIPSCDLFHMGGRACCEQMRGIF